MQQNNKIWLFFLKYNEEQDFKYENDKFSTWVKWYYRIWQEPMSKSGQIAFILP